MRKREITSSRSGSEMNRNVTSILRGGLASFCVALLAFAIGPLSNLTTTVNAGRVQGEQISESGLSQIRSLIEQKLKRTPVQQKIDSNLLAAIRVSLGEPVSANAPAIQPDVKIEADGKVMVDIDATVTEGLLEQIKAGRGEIVNSFTRYAAIRARLPLTQIESLARSASVRYIRRAVEMELNRAGQEGPDNRPSPSHAQSQLFAQRANRVRSLLPQTLNSLAVQKKKRDRNEVVPLIGQQTSEGDVAHSAATARSTFFVNGAGVKIGVLSDSFNNLGSADIDVTNGDLPGPGNPNGFVTAVTVLQDALFGGVDEGRAMLQIVHDLAPGAQLYFATALQGSSTFASNIQALRDAGCRIIIDGVSYTDESPFQDGVIAEAINSVTAAGAVYFSAAGNSGNLNDNTSGVWEGDFNDSGVDLIVGGESVGRLHIFSGTSTLNTVTAGGSSRRADLFWSDALGQSANDYDLYVLNSSGTNVVRMSNSDQTGTQDPYESVSTLSVGEKIAVVKFSGATRALNLSTGRGRLQFATAGQIKGHACALDAFAVAAVNVATSGGGPFFGGENQQVETFSSDGLRRVFYDASGAAITPGNFLFGTNGGTVRQKPDLAAADGVVTTLPGISGLNPFFGTSAAASHAGAIAGLLLSFKPELTAGQVRAVLTSSALDIEAIGIDRDSGYGIVMAPDLLQAAAALRNDTIGVYQGSTRTFYLRNNNTQGFADLTIPYGPPGAKAVVGDWNGDGITTIGVYDPATRTFYLRNSNTAGLANLTIQFGPAGAIPLAGDWDGDGVTTIGVYDPADQTFYLRNSNSLGLADVQIKYGPAGATPIVGDWDGNGTTTIGVYDPTNQTFYLRNSNMAGIADLQLPYGPAGALPVVGDWDLNGTVTIGVYDPTNQTFYLRNSNSIGFADLTISYGPAAATPLAGDWDGL